MAKKIGGDVPLKSTAVDEHGNPIPEVKKERLVFDVSTAVDAAGKPIPVSEGKLTAVPANYEFGKFKGLKKTDFDGEPTWLDYNAALYDFRASRFVKRATRFRKDAERLRKFGDEATRKKASRLMKAREQMEALEKELASQGFDMDLLT